MTVYAAVEAAEFAQNNGAGKLIRREIEPLEIHMQAFYIASALVMPAACVVDRARIIE